MTDDPQEAPPPSAPQPVNGQPTVAARGTPGPAINAQVQVVIDPRQRGSLSAGFHARAWQGYDTYKTDIAGYFREIAQCNPDFIAFNAERFDRTANSSSSFLQDPSGRFVAQYTMANGNYNLARVYDMTDPRVNGDRDQFARMRGQLVAEQQRINMDPLRRAQIDARHAFEDIALKNPDIIMRDRHVYEHSGRNGVGEAYLIQNINGREYGGRYAFENGYFRMQQMFDLQNPGEARAFQQQEEASLAREYRGGQRVGPYGGGMPIPYPGRGGTDVGVVIGNGRGGSEVGVHVGNRREGTDVGVVIGTDRRGDVHGGGHVDMRLPGGGRFDIGIFKR